MAVTFDRVMERIPNFHRFNISLRGFKKISKVFLKMMTSAKMTSSIFLNFTHIQHGFYVLKFIPRKKPEDM